MINGLTDRAGSMGAVFLLLAAGVVLSGCTRGLYRRQADRESHYLVREKSVGTPWEIPERQALTLTPKTLFVNSNQWSSIPFVLMAASP